MCNTGHDNLLSRLIVHCGFIPSSLNLYSLDNGNEVKLNETLIKQLKTAAKADAIHLHNPTLYVQCTDNMR